MISLFTDESCIKENGKYYYSYFKDNPNINQDTFMVKKFNLNCMLYFLSKGLLKFIIM